MKRSLFVLAIIFTAAFAGNNVASAYTEADLNNRLIGGFSTAYTWDRNCWDAMHANRAAGQAVRTAINNGGAYSGALWMHPYGNPSTTEVQLSGANVNATSIQLQISAVDFICSSLVAPDGAGADYPNTSDRLVGTTGGQTPDRAPGAIGSAGNLPAATGSNWTITGTSASTGYVAPGIIGSTLGTPRDASTRYWFGASPALTYIHTNAAGQAVPFTDGEQIVINIWYRKIAAFHYSPPDSRGTYTCLGNLANAGSWSNFAPCQDTLAQFVVTVRVPGPDGAFDSATCDGLNGWTLDSKPGPFASSTNVHAYFSTKPDFANAGHNEGFAAASNGTGGIGVNLGDHGLTHYNRPDIPPARPQYNYASGSNLFGWNWQLQGNSDPSASQFINGQQWYVTPYVISNSGSGPNPAMATRTFGPCYSYSLTPTSSVNGNGAAPKSAEAAPTDTIKFNYDVDNTGLTKSQGTWWTARMFIVPSTTSWTPGTTTKILTGAGANGNNIPTGISSTVLAYQDGGFIFNNGSNKNIMNKTKYSNLGYNSDMTTGDISIDLGGISLNIGDRVCTVLEVDPLDQTTTGAHAIQSAPACVTITKQPQMQIRGADSVSGALNMDDRTGTPVKIDKEGGFIGSGYNASNSTNNNASRGSWSQYGLIANGNSTNTTGGLLSNFGSAGYTTTSNATWSSSNACKLWFANTTGNGNSSSCSGTSATTGGKFGDLNHTISLPPGAMATSQTAAQAAITTKTVTNYTSTSMNLNTQANGVYYHQGNINISGSAIPNSRQIYLIVTGDVTVSGNITANGPYVSLDQIPIITVAANNINVSSGVTNIFGTYIAGVNGSGATAQQGTFNSCNAGYTGASADMSATGACSTSPGLMINGAIITRNSPKFQRTYGGDSSATTATAPAEVVNYGPNLFLTPYVDSTNGANMLWKTTQEVRLPARL